MGPGYIEFDLVTGTALRVILRGLPYFVGGAVTMAKLTTSPGNSATDIQKTGEGPYYVNGVYRGWQFSFDPVVGSYDFEITYDSGGSSYVATGAYQISTSGSSGVSIPYTLQTQSSPDTPATSGQSASFQFSIRSTTSTGSSSYPVDLHINWGDGTPLETYPSSAQTNGFSTVNVPHVYSSPGTRTIVFFISDSSYSVVSNTSTSLAQVSSPQVCSGNLSILEEGGHIVALLGGFPYGVRGGEISATRDGISVDKIGEGGHFNTSSVYDGWGFLYNPTPGSYVFTVVDSSNSGCVYTASYETSTLRPPSNVQTSFTPNSPVQVSWTPSPDNSLYEVSRKKGSGSWTVLATDMSGTSYSDSGLTRGETVSYRVRGRSLSLYSTYAISSDLTYQWVDPVVTPSAPTLSAVIDRFVDIRVSISSTGTTNVLERSSGGGFSQVYSGASQTFLDSDVVRGSTYTYRARSANSAGTSPNSQNLVVLYDWEDPRVRSGDDSFRSGPAYLAPPKGSGASESDSPVEIGGRSPGVK